MLFADGRSELFTPVKKRIVKRGERWEEITAKLNHVSDFSFNLKGKRAAIDLWAIYY